MTTFETSAPPNLTQNLRIAQDLVRTLAEQDEAVKQAYTRGYRDGAHDLAYVVPDAFEAGRADMEREVNTRWAEVAARSHFLGSPMSRTYAEKRAAELAACQPRDTDFPGVEQDPHCLDRVRASIESIAHDARRAAA